MSQHLKFDAVNCTSVPMEKASPELLEQLKRLPLSRALPPLAIGSASAVGLNTTAAQTAVPSC